MVRALTTIAFDADDTLWHNERFFREAEDRFCEMLADEADADAVMARLLDHERATLPLYGFGVKGFILSMIETATDLAPPVRLGEIVPAVLALGRDMLAHPVELLPGVADTLDALAGRFGLMVVTKGDLFHQERKLAHSGLADFFGHVEIVSDKTAETYARIFDRHGQGARRAMMVGNSMKSDVIPALAAGAWGVHVPHGLTWALEQAERPGDAPRLVEVEAIAEVPGIAEAVASGQRNG